MEPEVPCRLSRSCRDAPHRGCSSFDVEIEASHTHVLRMRSEDSRLGAATASICQSLPHPPA